MDGAGAVEANEALLRRMPINAQASPSTKLDSSGYVEIINRAMRNWWLKSACDDTSARGVK